MGYDAGVLKDEHTPALSYRDAYKAWRHEWFRFNWIYPYLYPQLLAKAVLGLLSLAAVARSWTEKEPPAGSGRLFGILLLTSATV